MWQVFSVFIGAFLPKITYRILGLLGLSVIGFVGFEAVKNSVFEYIQNALGTIGSDVIGLMGLAGVDHYITIVVSAYFAVFTVNKASKIIGIK